MIIFNPAEDLVNHDLTGVEKLLIAKSEKNLKDIYKLFSRVRETLQFISKKFIEHIEL